MQTSEKKCTGCGWYEFGCVCDDSDKPAPVLNRAQRRALRHKKEFKYCKDVSNPPFRESRP